MLITEKLNKRGKLKELQMKQRTLLSFPAIILLSGAFAFAANVRTDYDHNAKFSNYQTYSWGTVKTADPLNEDRVKAAVNKDLQAKGWQLVPTGGSATVFAAGNVKNEQEAETMYDGMGGGWGGGWGWGGFGGFGGGYGAGGFGEATTTTENQRVGHLVVDIFDASNHHLLFRGVADNDLSNKASKNTKNMDKDIAQMFKKFPAPPHP
jgi:hypothetical protein